MYGTHYFAVFCCSFLCIEWLMSSGTLLLEISQFFLCFSDLIFFFSSVFLKIFLHRDVFFMH